MHPGLDLVRLQRKVCSFLLGSSATAKPAALIKRISATSNTLIFLDLAIYASRVMAVTTITPYQSPSKLLFSLDELSHHAK